MKLVKRGLEIPQTLEDWATCDLYNTAGEKKKHILDPVRKYKPAVKHIVNQYTPGFIRKIPIKNAD